MNRATRPVVALAVLAALAACGPESSAARPVVAASGSEDVQPAAPASCGRAPLDSALALRSNGGGCTGFGIAAALSDRNHPAALPPLCQQLVAVNPEWASVVNGGAGTVSTPVFLHGTVLDSHISTDHLPF